MNQEKKICKKCINVGLIGLPNAGKSTLMNVLLNNKISIVSRKPQTTRWSLLGDLRHEDTQIRFADTPGIFQAKTTLERLIVKNAIGSVRNVDVIVWLIDVSEDRLESYSEILKIIQTQRKPVIVVFNKVDFIYDPVQHVRLQEDIVNLVKPEDVFYISALKKTGIKPMVDKLLSMAQPGVWQPVIGIDPLIYSCELTREYLFNELYHELPYSVTVVGDSIMHNGGSITIRQTIITSSPKHKAILIGKGGTMLKKVGMLAREELGVRFAAKVSLFLHVVVKENWQEKPNANAIMRECKMV